jgi:hypothetical protein
LTDRLPVLIAAAGGRKLSGEHRADQIYTGPLWETYRTNAPRDPQGNPIGFRLYVISDEYGLVRGDDVLTDRLPVLIVACGGKKLSDPARADQIYTGSLWATYRTNAPRDPQGNPIGFRLYVISAEYGLVRGDEMLSPYDRVLVSDSYRTKNGTKNGTPVRRVSDLLPLVRDQARDEGLYGLPADKVFYAGAVGSREKPGPYLQVLRGAGLRFTPLSRALPGRGGVEHNRKALRAWLNAIKAGAPLPRAKGAQRMRSARQRAQAQRQRVGGDVTGITPRMGLHFASGSNNETEIRALVDANRAFGISLAEVGGPRRSPKLQKRVLALQRAGVSRQQAIQQALAQAKERQAPGMVVLTSLYSRPGNKPPLFIDSGAFSEIKKKVELTDEQWQDRLGLVIKFLETIGPAAAALVTVVAPDKVGDQAETLARLRSYREQVRQINELGARVVVPLQAGRLNLKQMGDEVQRILATTTYRWWVPGLPLTRQSPLKNEQASDYLKEVRPARVHLLGVGEGNQERLRDMRKAISQHAPDTLVQMDSMLWGRTRTKAARDEITEASAGWEEDLSRDELGDFTEDVAEPSFWTSPLERYEVGKQALLDPDDLLFWVVDPDHYINDDSRENAYLYQTLESLWAEKKRARRGATRELEPVEILQDPDFTGPQWVEIY